MPKMYTSYRLLLYIFLFVVMMTLYPSTRSSNCIFINCINKFKTTTHVKPWVKISKIMPQPKSISPGKGREALRQKVQISRLQYGTA